MEDIRKYANSIGYDYKEPLYDYDIYALFDELHNNPQNYFSLIPPEIIDYMIEEYMHIDRKNVVYNNFVMAHDSYSIILYPIFQMYIGYINNNVLIERKLDDSDFNVIYPEKYRYCKVMIVRQFKEIGSQINIDFRIIFITTEYLRFEYEVKNITIIPYYPINESRKNNLLNRYKNDYYNTYN